VFDVIHVHFGFNAIPIARIKMKGKLKNTKLITTFHGTDLARKPGISYADWYKNVFSYSDALIVNTPFLANHLRKMTTAVEKIKIIPVGLNTAAFYNQAINNPATIKKRFTVLFCGRLIKLKGPDLLIKTAKILVEQKEINDLEVRIIGSGEMEKSLKKLACSLNINDKITFLGSIPNEKVAFEMKNADVLVLPGITDTQTNRAETQGLVIQEAQTMETPVIVSDAGGMKHGLIDGVTGFVVKENSISGFVEKLEFLYNSPSLGLEMGKNGRKFVANNYDTSVLGDELLKIYSA